MVALIPEDVLKQLSDCCNEPKIHVQLTSDDSIKQRVDELVVRADAIEFADPAFRDGTGLLDWPRSLWDIVVDFEDWQVGCNAH